MIRRFEWIRKTGFFDDFACGSALPDFGTINLIYGANGSGKSSLSRLFLELSSGDEPDFGRLSCSVDGPSGPVSTNGQPHEVFKRVMVFNSEYVRRNLRFEEMDPTAVGLLTVGKRTVDSLERARELRSEIVECEVGLRDAKQKWEEAEARIKQSRQDVSGSVVGAVHRSGGRYQSKNKYNQTTVANRLSVLGASVVALSDEDLSARIADANSEAEVKITWSASPPAVERSFVESAAALFEQTPVSVVLDTLERRPDASRWVQSGLELHGPEDPKCLFCGGEFTPGRRQQLNNHFSTAVQTLQSELKALLAELQQATSSIESWNSGLPSSTAFAKSQRDKAQAERASALEASGALTRWCDELDGRIRAKLDNVFEVDSDPVDLAPTLDSAALAALVSAHNRTVDQHAHEVAQAAEAVEKHYLAAAKPEIDSIAADIKKYEADVRRLRGELADLRQALEEEEHREADPRPSAETLTRGLESLLGRRELIFELAGPSYRVTRNGNPATGLSEGEQTAIAVLYFLEDVRRRADNSPEVERPIVLIDDPVTSLDQNSFMGISTRMWAEIVTSRHISQTFLLTHNHELFRHWTFKLDALPNKVKKALPHEVYELVARYKDSAGAVRRVPELSPWPSDTTLAIKLWSTYHHSFYQLASSLEGLRIDDSLEARLDARLLVPNVARRVLETFLGFRYPEETGSFEGSLRRAFAELEHTTLHDPVRLRLLQYLHAHSHADAASPVDLISPDEVGTIIEDVFRFMSVVDEFHFNGMCLSVGADAGSLVPALEPADDVRGRSQSHADR